MATGIVVKISDADAGEAFDIAEAYRLASPSGDTGAIATFVGYVRHLEHVPVNEDDDTGEFQEVGLSALHIEHFPGMTEQVIEDICQQACQRWNLQCCRVTHRVGTLAPGEPIVMVLTAAGHRADAFDACELIMDFLKTDAPFWKKVKYASGEHWVEAKESDTARRERWSKTLAGK